jgi:hypothetical protein
MNCTVEGMTLNRFQELVLYLLQLVQALKFESSSNEQRSSRSTSNVISYEDSGLSDFLITRSVRNPVLGNRLHWYLMVEVSMEDRVMAKMFARVDWNFMRKVEEVICHHWLRFIILTWILVGGWCRTTSTHAQTSRARR